jgi:hypothetical protein
MQGAATTAMLDASARSGEAFQRALDAPNESREELSAYGNCRADGPS